MLKAVAYNKFSYCGDGCCMDPEGTNVYVYDGETEVFETSTEFGQAFEAEDVQRLLVGTPFEGKISDDNVEIQC